MEASIKTFITIAGFLLSSLANAGEPEARLEKLLNGLESYSAAFEQTSENNAGETTETAIGVVYMQRPGRIHWAYWEPYIQLIVSDGVSVWNYEEDLEQVIIRDASDSIEDSPAAVLGGKVDIEEHYIVLELGEEEGIEWLELTPKDLEAQYESIRLGFVNEDLAGMVLNDGLGNRTNIKFLDTQANPKLADELFKFTPPEGVDIIDNRAQQDAAAPAAE
jgi:chaperone LolA